MPQRIEFEGVVHEFPDGFSDADIAVALGETAAPQSSSSPTNPTASQIGVVARAARPGVERAALEIATNPKTATAAKGAAKIATSRAVSTGIGAVVGGGVPGAIAGSLIPSEQVAGKVGQGLEGAARGGGSLVARLAGSKLAQTALGPVGQTALAGYDVVRAGQEAVARGEKIGSLPTVEDVRAQINQSRRSTADIVREVIAQLTGS
jgi:hypothetical protein